MIEMNECEKKESASSLNVAAVGSILSFVGTLLGRGLSFVIRVVITRIFGAKYFGLLAIGIMVSEMARIVGSVGLPKGGMRFTSLSIGEKKLEKLPPILGTSALVPLCLSVALSGAILLLADKISVGWFHNREVSQVIKLMCIGIPFAAVLRVCSDISKGFSTTVYSVIVESVFMPLSTIVLFLLFFLLKLGFMSIVYSLICSYILSAILMITFLIRQMLQVMEPVGSFSSLLKSSIDLQVGKEILVYSFPLFLSGFTIIVLNSVDIVMLGRFMQLDAVGIYAAAATFPAFLSLLIIMSVNSIFAPLVATHYGKKDIATIGLLYKATTRWVFYITLPLVGAIVILRKEIMAIFGRDFVAVGSVVLCLLMIGQMINCVTGGVGYLLAMTGHQKKELGINVMVIVLNVILNVVLIWGNRSGYCDGSEPLHR